ncbi:MAG TPA: VWA domain-containing protein [Nordella sp.]|nr:VWA domain-containing protein [Nordella sp.]
MFLGAVRLLGPRSMDSIRHAALATLAPPVDRLPEFNVLFHSFFVMEGDAIVAARSLPEEDGPVKDKGLGQDQPPEVGDTSRSGKAATLREMLNLRRFDEAADDASLARLQKQAPRDLPRRQSFRKEASKDGKGLDLRRSLRRIVAHDGDILVLMRSRRKTAIRPIVLLIDISGSMKTHTADYLSYAQALTGIAGKVETFTFGTRLTRITPALRQRPRHRALASAAALVGDWDGGTRIGPTLKAFLANPRYAALLRGAVVLVLSDGLERGDHAPMRDAVARISRRAWFLAWLTPLAADPRFRPETAALKDILLYIDRLGSGGSISSLVDHTLRSGSRA